MKLLKNLLILMLLTSCKSNYKIIEKFIIDNQENDTINKNVLIKRKNSFFQTYTALQRVGINMKISNEKILILKKLNDKYSEEKTTLWQKKNFKKIDFDLIEFDSLDNYLNYREKTIKNKSHKFNVNLFKISNPYFYNNGKNVLFYITKNQIKHNKEYDFAVIMKKYKGKWVVAEKVPNYFPDLR